MADAKPEKRSIKILKYLIFSIIVLFPFSQLTQIPFTAGIRIYMHDIMIGLLWLVVIFNYKSFLPFKNPKKNSLFLPSILFIGISAISLVIALLSLTFSQVFLGSLYLIRWTLYSGVGIASCLIIQNDASFKKQVTQRLIIVGASTSIFGLFQYLLYPDLRNLYYLGWDPHYLRIFGTFLDPNFLGLVIVLTLIITIVAMKNSWAKYSLLVINSLTLALTYSRSSFVSVVCALLTLFIFKKQKKLILILLGMGIVIFFFLPKGPQSEGIQLERLATLKSRAESIEKGLVLFRRSPFIGVGFNTLRFHQKINPQKFREEFIPENAAGGIENSFIFLLATTGILGFISYIYLLRNMYKRGDPILKVSLIAVFIHSLFNNSLFYPWIMIWIWFLAGVSIGQIKNNQ